MQLKNLYLGLFIFSLGIFSLQAKATGNTTTTPIADQTVVADSVLRHVVLFKFKPNTAASDIQKVEAAFTALPGKIPQIQGYEWGTNNSPEGLDKGFTHCFFLSFNSEEDRAIYLPHPDHKAFGAVLTPHLEDVLVLDYWTATP